MLPLILLAGLVAVVMASNDNGSGTVAVTTADDHTIALTCDEALALIPEPARTPIATAIATGTSAPGLRALANYLETTAASSAPNDTIAAAYLIAGHCLRAREASLPAPSASTTPMGPLTADTRSIGYRADFGG